MATDKKHIAVYLDPAVEQALVAFCEQKGLMSKKGTMYSAGVNAALAQFFGIADIDNILQSSSNIPTVSSTIPANVKGNTPAESIDVEVSLGKPDGLSDGSNESLRQELEEARTNYAKLLKSSTAVTKKLDQEVQELRSQLETLQTAQPVANLELPEAPDLLNKLKAKRKKATASLADVETILEILEG
jgi:hypothetical protein